MPRVSPTVTQYPVSPKLAPFIHRFVYGISEEPGELRIPPTGGVFLSFVPGSPLVVHFKARIYTRKPRLFLGGQLRHERPVLRSEGRFELIGAEFTPTGYYKLFHQKANRLTDSIADLAKAHPDVAATLEARLSERSGPTESMIAAIEAVLGELAETAAEAPRVDAMVHDINGLRGIIRLSEVYSRHPVTPRQMRRSFEGVVGVSPKHYAKICQVNAVVRAMMENDSERLRSLALDHGFYDQAHFIHDFRKFVATDPGSFLRDGSQFLRTYLGNTSRLQGAASN